MSCEDLTEPGQCSPVTHRELQEAAAYLGVAGRRRRRPRSVLGLPSLPPVITIAGERPQCRQCEVRNSLCFLFGLGRYNNGDGAQ